jgi:hypothetical protein
MKEQSASAARTTIGAPAAFSNPWSIFSANPVFFGAGPFAPDTTGASENRGLTKCRNCSWFSRLFAYGPSGPSNNDWCHSCGCVASVKALGKDQAMPLKKTDVRDLFQFGQKEILFTIKAHDPRQNDKYKKFWNQNPEFQYDEADREEEVFLHLVGNSPQLNNLSKVIAKQKRDKISDNDDAIIFEDSRLVTLIYGLVETIRTGIVPTSCVHIKASWNKQARSGTIQLTLRLPNSYMMGNNVPRSRWMPYLVALWFDVEFEVSDLSRHLDASPDKAIEFFTKHRASTLAREDMIPAFKQLLESGSEDLNDAHALYLDSLTLNSSDGQGGGTADSDTTLKGVLKRYYQEHFECFLPHSFLRGDPVKVLDGHTNRQNGFNSLDGLVGFENAVIAENNFHKELHGEELSINDIMARLENLGHASELVVEGLNVELLPFQKQSLKFCLDRENTPGGINALLWPKLPSSGHSADGDLYFNPISQQFRTTKPALARGGLLCEQMVS